MSARKHLGDVGYTDIPVTGLKGMVVTWPEIEHQGRTDNFHIPLYKSVSIAHVFFIN